ncbi:ATP-binding protein [Streptomyces sp. NPDC056500]|uniref:ATP-binding protein n=1 Tax=Streptomyces sp. NPDC056500 TaxID=3345840 RepID=UPI00367F2813
MGLAVVITASALTDLYTSAELGKILAWACAATAVLALAWTLFLIRLLGLERTARRADVRMSEARADEVAHLVEVRIPAIVEYLRTGERPDAAPGPLAGADEVGQGFTDALEAVVEALGSEDAVRRERTLRDSVQAAFESVARNMHAMATVQQQVLDRVEQTIEDPRLLAEVMKADHAAAQMTRKAQTLLVMCGIWPARREINPVSLYDCVRGAQSRIVEFTRIEVHGGQTLYVVPPAVEGLMHTIAELLENATVFSPSRTQVVVTIREVGAGAVVEIDDAGLGMPPDVLTQSTARLKADLDLANLGAVPRLGLACVGRWSRELGFGVELTGTSAYGGTRAVAFVPYRLLTEPLSHFSDGRHRGNVRFDEVRAREQSGRAGWPAPGSPPSAARHTDAVNVGAAYAGGGYGPTEYTGAGPDDGQYEAAQYAGPSPSGTEYGGIGRPSERATGEGEDSPGAVYRARGRSTASAAYHSQVRATAAYRDRRAAQQEDVSHGYEEPAGPVFGNPPADGMIGGSEAYRGAVAAQAAAAYRGMVQPPVPHPGAPQHTTAYQDGQGAAQHPGAHPTRGRSDTQPTAPRTDVHQTAARVEPGRYGGAQQDGTADTPLRPPGLRESARQNQGQTQNSTAQPLPRRRSRRGAAVEAAAQQALQPQPSVPAAPPVPADRPAWTPEAARASISSVVSGSRRGRAAVAGAAPSEHSEHLSEPNPHHGGRL